MEFRFLGNSGLKVSAISHGNGVTHGWQVEADQATTCAAGGGHHDVRHRKHVRERSRRNNSGRCLGG
jgi:hypothetical protein